MKMRAIGLLMVGLLMVGGASADEYDIPVGTAEVDGVLGEWAEATWIQMDKTYHGSPTRVSDAMYAARWDPGENLIYAAVTANDTDHQFNASYGGWDAQDAVEIYVDSGNRDSSGDMELQPLFQQYVVGYDGAGGSWAILYDGRAIPEGDVSFAAAVDGDTINYEIAITPYFYYTGLGAGAEAESIVDLAQGLTVGLDVVLAVKRGSGGFGMLCNNTIGGKYANAAAFQDHTLVGDGGPAAPGDADLNGRVDDDDLSLLLASWGQDTDWGHGEFSGLPPVDDDDLSLLLANWSAIPGAAVPEPATLALLAFGAVAALRRKR